MSGKMWLMFWILTFFIWTIYYFTYFQLPPLDYSKLDDSPYSNVCKFIFWFVFHGIWILGAPFIALFSMGAAIAHVRIIEKATNWLNKD